MVKKNHIDYAREIVITFNIVTYFISEWRRR